METVRVRVTVRLCVCERASESVRWFDGRCVRRTQGFTVWLDLTAFGLRLVSTMAASCMSLVCSLLMVVLLAGPGGFLTPLHSQFGVECGEMCGGFAGYSCVPECHCVYYPGDFGVCLPHGQNESNLPPL
ncbi:hypothetical protein MTO96_048305 [Rhipicephalus appendiculatus]